MTDPNAGEATFGAEKAGFRIVALEGQGGLMRLWLEGGAGTLAGQRGTLQMHDGARFQVEVLERLPGDECRVRLVAQLGSG